MLMERKSLVTAGCLAVLYSVWGSTYLAQRIAVAAMPPLFMGGLRFAIAGAMLYAALRLRGTPAPSRREWGAAVLSAVPLMMLGMGTVAIAMTRAPSGLAALVFGGVPLWTSIFDRAFGGRLSRVELVGLATGLAGLLVVSLRGSLAADPASLGLLIFAAASYSLGCVLTRRLALAKGAMSTASQMVAGGAALLLASAARGEHWTVGDRSSVAALAYLVVMGTVVGYTAFGWLLRNARPALATSYAFVNPVVALGLGAALGGERFAAGDYAGLALVLAAVGVVAWGGRAAAPAWGFKGRRGSPTLGRCAARSSLRS